MIMEGYDRHSGVGMLTGCTQVLGYAAEAAIRGRDWQTAELRLASAMDLARRMGEQSFVPDLLLLQGRVAMGRGDIDGARAGMRAALQHAAARQALWQQLEALVALCELEGASADDFSLLKAVLAQLSEGEDFSLLRKAVSLSGARRTRGSVVP
jgi:hypothetical protein